MFVLICWLRLFLSSAVANRFELRCQLKQLLLLYYKICPWCVNADKLRVGGTAGNSYKNHSYLMSEKANNFGGLWHNKYVAAIQN